MNSSKSKLQNKRIIKIIAIVLAIVIFIAAAIFFFTETEETAKSFELEAYTVNSGNISVSITGSGMVEPIEQYEIQSIVTGDIIEDNVIVGTDVQKGDILYVVDSESARNSIERSEANYQQQLISHNEKIKNYNKTESKRAVTAPISGVITELDIKNGDEIKSGVSVCKISNTDNLTVRIPFLSANAKNISKNQAATVYFEERNESISGYVSHVTTGTYTTASGAIVSDIEITFKNPGAILPGESVSATVGNFACNDMGTVCEVAVETVITEVSGEVSGLKFSEGDHITGGTLLMNIVDETSDSDIRSSELSLKNARLSLDDQIEKLNDYTITSPISGTVISKTLKGGDTLDGNKSSLAIVADMSKLTFDISVDELDIKDIRVGQSVKITADALPDKEFSGVVDTISIIGTSSSGVTVYPVTIVISEYEGLLPGMNVNAEIVTSEANDVLIIPINSVTRGNYVLVKDDSSITGITEKNSPSKNGKRPDSTSSTEGITPPEGIKPSNSPTRTDASGNSIPGKSRVPEAPEGYRYVKVELGAASEDYIEVTNGLSEGDEIFITVVKSTQSSTSGFGAGGGMPGGMGGGMPGGMSGGMPGGMSGGRGNIGMGGMR